MLLNAGILLNNEKRTDIMTENLTSMHKNTLTMKEFCLTMKNDTPYKGKIETGGPRLVAWAAGWGRAAFPDQYGGFVLVYVLSPVAGGLLASLFFVHLIEPLMKKENGCNCN